MNAIKLVWRNISSLVFGTYMIQMVFLNTWYREDKGIYDIGDAFIFRFRVELMRLHVAASCVPSLKRQMKPIACLQVTGWCTPFQYEYATPKGGMIISCINSDTYRTLIV